VVLYEFRHFGTNHRGGGLPWAPDLGHRRNRMWPVVAPREGEATAPLCKAPDVAGASFTIKRRRRTGLTRDDPRRMNAEEHGRQEFDRQD
jgi:hypothetical protein